MEADLFTRPIQLSLFVAAVVSFAADTQAGPVTWVFEGEATLVVDHNNVLGGTVDVGSPLLGQFTFDLTGERAGFYEGAILSLSGTLGGVSFSGPIGKANSISVYNDIPFDSFGLDTGINVASTTGFFQIGLFDSSGRVFSSNELPFAPPSINAIDADGAVFAFGRSDETLGVNGELSSILLVPEPSAGVLLLIGVLLGFANSGPSARKRRTGESTNRRALGSIFVFAMGLWAHSTLFFGTPALAEDCNENGIDDSVEIAVCPPLDVVFLLDSSPSTSSDLAAVCNDIQSIVEDLESYGLVIHDEILNIGNSGPGQVCPCCVPNATVSTRYGDSTSSLPENLTDCSGAPSEQRREDWGPATAIVAGNKTWTTGAIRIIVPVGDEGPRCGDPVNDPGDDRDAISHAIPIVAANTVIVMPVVIPSDPSVPYVTPEVTILAQELADGGAPGGHVFSSLDANLVFALADYVRSRCPAQDCNANGVPDECDIAEATSRDCHRKVGYCCHPRTDPGCPVDEYIEEQICEFIDPTCCSVAWSIACA